jgi:hypothetical protein
MGVVAREVGSRPELYIVYFLVKGNILLQLMTTVPSHVLQPGRCVILDALGKWESGMRAPKVVAVVSRQEQSSVLTLMGSMLWDVQIQCLHSKNHATRKLV